MKETLKQNLGRAFRVLELSVAVALLAVLLELLLIHLSHPHDHTGISLAGDSTPGDPKASTNSAKTDSSAPLQLAAKPANPKAAPAPPAPVRPIPVPPQRPPSPPIPANPPPLLSFFHLRREIHQFTQFNWFLTAREPLPASGPSHDRPATSTSVITNATTTAAADPANGRTNHVQGTNTARAPTGRTPARQGLTRTTCPAGFSPDQPGSSAVAVTPPDARHTHGVFRLAMP